MSRKLIVMGSAVTTCERPTALAALWIEGSEFDFRIMGFESATNRGLSDARMWLSTGWHLLKPRW